MARRGKCRLPAADNTAALLHGLRLRRRRVSGGGRAACHRAVAGFDAEEADLLDHRTRLLLQRLGGGGIFPTEGLPEGTCELVKMYLLPEARGIGLGRTLIEHCLQVAREIGFQQVYLETLTELHLALKIYEKFGFEYLSAPLGNTKHFGCGLWMLKKL